jgi:hypothetical protein
MFPKWLRGVAATVMSPRTPPVAVDDRGSLISPSSAASTTIRVSCFSSPSGPVKAVPQAQA